MPRPKRAARNRRPTISDGEYMWAADHPDFRQHPDYVDVVYFTFPERQREVWGELRDELVATHIEEYPGTRPKRWWQFDAREPRQRVGGTGDPISEVLAYAPSWDGSGLPARWFGEEDADSYDHPLTNHKHGRAAATLDPDDPPLFESQAAYLDRLGLLTKAERSELDKRGWPKPEAVKYNDPTIPNTTPLQARD